MSTAFIAIPVEAGKKLSEKEIIKLVSENRDYSGWCSNAASFYSSEEEAKNAAYDATQQDLLIIQIEKITTPDVWDHKNNNIQIGAFNKFGLLNAEKAIAYQDFSPKFRKLTLLKNYVNNQTQAHLSEFLNHVNASELHTLANMLVKDTSEKTNQTNVATALSVIEKAFVKQQEETNFNWTVAAILTLSFAYWVRKLCFPETFNGFVTHNFKANELENVRSGISKFWHYLDLRGYLAGYRHKPNAENNKTDNPETFKEKFTTRAGKVEFNQYGELKKQVVYHEETQTYEVTGTKQQINRWLAFQDYGKKCEYDSQNVVRDRFYQGVETFFLGSADESRVNIMRGEKTVDPFKVTEDESKKTPFTNVKCTYEKICWVLPKLPPPWKYVIP